MLSGFVRWCNNEKTISQALKNSIISVRTHKSSSLACLAPFLHLFSRHCGVTSLLQASHIDAWWKNIRERKVLFKCQSITKSLYFFYQIDWFSQQFCFTLFFIWRGVSHVIINTCQLWENGVFYNTYKCIFSRVLHAPKQYLMMILSYFWCFFFYSKLTIILILTVVVVSVDT